MKIARLLFIFVFIFVTVISTNTVQAQRFDYTSGFQVQNLSNTEASVTLNYYNASDGLSATQAVTTIPALGSSNFFPIHAPDGFSGSVVISSSQPLASITNLIAEDTVLGRTAVASYIGFSNGGTSVFLPLLQSNNNSWYTWFTVQNTGGADADVTVTYSDGTTATFNDIKPGASHSFDQFSETHTLNVLSASVTSDQPIVVTVLEESVNNKTVMAYNGLGSAEPNTLIPLVNINNGLYKTGIQLQNVGSSTSTITLTYYPSVAGTECTESHTIEAGKSATYAYLVFSGTPMESGASSTCIANERFVGSAQVTSNTGNVNINAIVNQVANSIGYGSAYSSFVPGNLTSKVVFPLIMDRNNGWYTGINIMNAGNQSVTVNCVFTNTSYTVSGTIDPGESITAVQNNNVQSGYVGSGTCTATGSGTNLISGVVNEVGTYGIDRLMTYEGLNVVP